jgi:hypothetical protein
MTGALVSSKQGAILARPFHAQNRTTNHWLQSLTLLSNQNPTHRRSTHPGFERDSCWPEP